MHDTRAHAQAHAHIKVQRQWFSLINPHSNKSHSQNPASLPDRYVLFLKLTFLYIIHDFMFCYTRSGFLQYSLQQCSALTVNTTRTGQALSAYTQANKPHAKTMINWWHIHVRSSLSRQMIHFILVCLILHPSWGKHRSKCPPDGAAHFNRLRYVWKSSPGTGEGTVDNVQCHRPVGGASKGENNLTSVIVLKREGPILGQASDHCYCIIISANFIRSLYPDEGHAVIECSNRVGNWSNSVA